MVSLAGVSTEVGDDAHPDSRYSPVSLQSKLSTQPPCPVKFATCSPDVTSYSAMIRASPPAARSFDAGEKATLRTGWTRPARECARRPVSLLKTYIEPFSWPDAVKVPLRL
jgi:hypothetical protein